MIIQRIEESHCPVDHTHFDQGDLVLQIGIAELGSCRLEGIRVSMVCDACTWRVDRFLTAAELVMALGDHHNTLGD